MVYSPEGTVLALLWAGHSLASCQPVTVLEGGRLAVPDRWGLELFL